MNPSKSGAMRIATAMISLATFTMPSLADTPPTPDPQDDKPVPKKEVEPEQSSTGKEEPEQEAKTEQSNDEKTEESNGWGWGSIKNKAGEMAGAAKEKAGALTDRATEEASWLAGKTGEYAKATGGLVLKAIEITDTQTQALLEKVGITDPEVRAKIFDISMNFLPFVGPANRYWDARQLHTQGEIDEARKLCLLACIEMGLDVTVTATGGALEVGAKGADSALGMVKKTRLLDNLMDVAAVRTIVTSLSGTEEGEPLSFDLLDKLLTEALEEEYVVTSMDFMLTMPLDTGAVFGEATPEKAPTTDSTENTEEEKTKPEAKAEANTER